MAMSQAAPTLGNSELLYKILLIRALMQQQQQQAERAPATQQPAKSNLPIKELISMAKSLFSGGDAATATSSFSPSLATPATQVAWNADAIGAGGMSAAPDLGAGTLYTPATGSAAGAAGTTGASTSAGAAGTTGAFDLGGIGSSGNAILPIAGIIGAADLLKNERVGKRGYIQGALSGAAAGSYFGPWGAAIGGAVGLGLGGANELLDTNRWKKEGNRLAKLEKSGINIPEALKANIPRAARKFSEMENKSVAKDFIGYDPKGQWINNKFNSSRSESDLRPEDIWGYSSFLEKFGNDWLGKFNEQQRRAIAQKALDQGAVNEHHGTIDIDWLKVGDVNQLTGATPAAASQVNVPRPPPGQVGRLSPGVYRTSNGQLQIGNKIPRAAGRKP